jgi:hypothetical protein
MKGHKEDMCCFKLKAMQEAQQKVKGTSSEVFAVEQEEMSEFSDASDNIKVMPEM